MTEPIALTQLEVPDYDLGLRGKVMRAAKSHKSGLAFCTIVYGLSLVDEVTDTPISNVGNGYPDAPLTVDESTRIELPWRRGMDAVLADLVDSDGAPLEVSPRTAVRSLASRFGEWGVEPILGFEYELWLFRDGPAGRVPVGRTENAYSLTRSVEIGDLLTEYVSRMDQIGIEIEMMHSELGPGFFEFTLAPRPALQACDNAARARQYLRDLCAERGLHASFMAKPYGDKSGAGGHVHSSLNRNGENIFVEKNLQLSPDAEHYLAGLVTTMADVTLLLNPYVNSYKRIDPAMFTPCTASWGDDDRSSACRLILGDRHSARVEHRRPGADATPYLVAIALLAGGLRGLQQRTELPAADVGPAALPGDLRSALTHFENAIWLNDMLGKDFCATFASTRRAEVDRYETWLKTTITEWETARHLEHQ